MMSLALILKEHREKYGLTQLQLAETLHVDERTLRRWEHQETRLTDVRELRRLASVLGVAAERLGVTDQAGGISPEQADETLHHVWQLIAAARFFEARAVAERLVAELQTNAPCPGCQAHLYRLTQAHRVTAYVRSENTRTSEVRYPLASYRAMEQTARLLDDPPLLALALAFEGEMYTRVGEVNTGNEYLETALGIAPDEDSPAKGAVALLLAKGYFKAGQRGAYERWMAEAEARAEQVTGDSVIGEPFGLKAVYAEYGRSSALLGNLHQALEYIERAQHLPPFGTYWDLVLKTTTVMALIRGGEIQCGVALAVECIELCRKHGAFRLLERIYRMQQYLQCLTTSLEQSTALLREALDGPIEY
ncbi:MAG: helix-turn-helix transcriptional regulator [Chloroflexi bacterium]|nr:MAG: helix-turn-helix transcriptional regulator [Chloroflexota bacterium]